MKAEYITHSGSDLLVVNAARVSMNKESTWDWNVQDGEELHLTEKDAKLINYLARHQHLTPFEHCTITMRLKVPLFARSQIHRHRTFAYNEISRRYVTDDLEFYWPDKWRKAAENVKQGSSDEEVFLNPPTPEAEDLWGDVDNKWHPTLHMQYLIEQNAREQYGWLLSSGVCSEQARMILPQNLYTEFYMTGNLRNWAHFLKLRLDSHAQKEARDIAEMCAKVIEPLFPVSYRALMEQE